VKQQAQKSSLSARIVRWIARAASVLSMGIILLFFVGEADFSQPVSISLQEWIGVLFFPIGILLGMILAWRREGIGAGITIGSLVAFYVYHFAVWIKFPSGPFFVLFASPGFLFGASWLLSQRRNATEATG
jgi:hypothetical protein